MAGAATGKRVERARGPRHAVALRRATASDLATLVAHRRAMFFALGGHGERELAASDAPYRRWIRGRLATRRAIGLVATRPGLGIVGSAVMWFREDQPRPGVRRLRVPYLMSVYVEPRSRGGGVATALTERLVAEAARLGYPRVVLHASRFGRSVYGRLGFERTWEMRYGPTYRRGPDSATPRDEAAGRRGRARGPRSRA